MSIRKQWLAGLIILLAAGIYQGDAASGKADTNRAIRIAILALDVSDEVQSIVPLLTASLTASRKVQLVERADLEKIISEQHLSLAGLNDPATQLRVGQLTRADGMIFISKDVKRDCIVLHMAETRQGFRVCLVSYPLSERALVAVAGDIQDNLLKSLAKLSLNPSQCLLLSIAHIANLTLVPDSPWIETELPVLMEQYFSRYSRVLILERRQLGQLLDEVRISAQEASSFRADGIIIDGELALTTGVPLDKKAPAVTFTLRFRNAAGRDLGRTVVQGILNDKEALVVRTVAAAVVKIQELGLQKEVRAEDESRLWLEVARKQGSLQAAESAYALDPTNIETQVTLIELLISRGAAHHDPPSHGGRRRCCPIPSETGEQHADALVRAYEVYSSAPSLPLRKAFAAIVVGNKGLFLCQDYSRDNSRTIERLKPIRRLIRLALEDSGDWGSIGYGSAFFCADPLDQVSYARDVVQRIIKDAPAESRSSHLLSFFRWGIWQIEERLEHRTNIDYFDRQDVKDEWRRFYQELRSSTESTAVFLACYYLACQEQSSEGRRKLAQEALTVGDSLVARCVAGQSAWDFADMYMHLCFAFVRDPSQMLYAITNVFQRLPMPPEPKKRIISYALVKYEDEVARQNRFSSPAIEETTGKLKQLPPSPPSIYGESLSTMVKSLPSGSALSGPTSLAAATNEKVLFATAWPQWRKQVRFLRQPQGSSAENGCIIPYRLLLDGSNLWIGAGTYESRAGYRWYGVGLVHLELPSGRLVSLRVDDGPDWAISHVHNGIEARRLQVTSLRRWNDAICMGQKNVGVYLFPLKTAEQEHGLNGVQLLTTADGLVSLELTAVTSIGSDLFIATYNNIVAWNRATRQIRLILNAADQLSAASLGNPGEIFGLTSDRQGRSLYAFFPPSGSNDNWIIWKLSLVDGKWTKISTAIKKANRPLADDYFHEFKAGKIILSRRYISDSQAGEPDRTFAYGGEFDADTEVITCYDSAAFRVLLPAIPSLRIQEAVEYNGGIIAILGQGADQRVSYFPGITFQSAIAAPTQ